MIMDLVSRIQISPQIRGQAPWYCWKQFKYNYGLRNTQWKQCIRRQFRPVSITKFYFTVLNWERLLESGSLLKPTAVIVLCLFISFFHKQYQGAWPLIISSSHFFFFFRPDNCTFQVLQLPHSSAPLYTPIPWYQNSQHHRHLHRSLQTRLLQLTIL